MSGPINPILVVKNNLPEYKAERLKQREKLIEQVNVIDEEMKVLTRLQAALEPVAADGVMTLPEDFDETDDGRFDPQSGRGV